MFGGSDSTILPFLTTLTWNFVTVTNFCPVSVLVNALLYYEIDNFEKDPETKDLQLVAEHRVGRNHGKAMGKS